MERILKKYRYSIMKSLDISFFSLLYYKRKESSKQATPIDLSLAILPLEFVTYLEINLMPGFLDWIFDSNFTSRCYNLQYIQMKTFSKQ